MRSITNLFRLPILPIIVVSVALFSPMILLGKALFWGTPALQFVPWWSWAWQTLLDGELPLWNPLLGMGAPLIANYQSALFYPPNWLYLLLYAVKGSPLMAWGQALLVALHLIWSGIGMVALVRRLGLSVLSQTIAGLSFAFCGYLVSRAGFLSINASVSWLPWILFFLTPRSLDERVSLRRCVLFIFCLSLQLLTGHAQTVWYTLILAGLWTGFWAWESGGISVHKNSKLSIKERFEPIARSWGGLLIGLSFAVFLSAVQIFPTAEYLLQSQRSQAVNYELAMTYSFWPWRLIDLFAPGFFGDPSLGDYWGYGNYWEDAIYIGLLPFLLALAALFGNLKSNDHDQKPEKDGIRITSLRSARRHLIWFLLILILITLVLSLGQNTPVFPWMYFNIPTFDLFQAPTRMMIWAEFALVILAALGAERWRRPEGRGLYWTRLGTAGAFAVTLGAGAAWYWLGDISPSFIRATAYTGIWGVLAGILSLLAPPRDVELFGGGASKPFKVWYWGVVVVVAVNLFITGRGANPSIDVDFYKHSKTGDVIRDQLGGKRLYLPSEFEESIKFSRFFLFETFEPGENWGNLREVMLPNLTVLDQVPSANNFDPMLPGRYTHWIDSLETNLQSSQVELLRLMNVGVLELVDDHQPVGVRFDPLDGGARSRWVPCAIMVTDQDAASDWVMGGDINLNTTVVVEWDSLSSMREDDTIVRSSEDCPMDFPIPMRVEPRVSKESPNMIEFQFEAPADGWFLISDTWYPGWNAWVDGEQVHVYPGDYLFRAIQVSKGFHLIVFRYQPLSFWLGAAVSGLAWVILASIWFKLR